MYKGGVRVQPKSRAEIANLAWTVRQISGCSSRILLFPIMTFLENTLPKLCTEFKYEIVENGTLNGGARAITYPAQLHILIEESVYDGACDGVGKDRMTIAHEVGHLFMHTGLPLAKHYEQVPVKIFENSEWQADVFAGELLAPTRLIEGMFPEQIADKFQISRKAAQTQFRAFDKKLSCA